MKRLRFLLSMCFTLGAFQLTQGASKTPQTDRVHEIRKLEELDAALLEAIEDRDLKRVQKLLKEGALATTSRGDAVEYARSLELPRLFVFKLESAVREARLRPLSLKMRYSTVTVTNTAKASATGTAKRMRRSNNLASKEPQNTASPTASSGSNFAGKLVSKSSAQPTPPLWRANATRNSSSATKNSSSAEDSRI